jgi:hypothetical protein
MRAVVVYESMYGNTRVIAEAIGAGLRTGGEAVVLPVGRADPRTLDGADLVVVGAPTHTFGLSRPQTRQAAVAAADKPGSGLTLEPGAAAPGIREWLPTVPAGNWQAAAFDTRLRMPAFIGHAARRLGRMLRRKGFALVDSPRSFFVNKQTQLLAGEEDRARAWGRQLAARVCDTTSVTSARSRR